MDRSVWIPLVTNMNPLALATEDQWRSMADRNPQQIASALGWDLQTFQQQRSSFGIGEVRNQYLARLQQGQQRGVAGALGDQPHSTMPFYGGAGHAQPSSSTSAGSSLFNQNPANLVNNYNDIGRGDSVQLPPIYNNRYPESFSVPSVRELDQTLGVVWQPPQPGASGSAYSSQRFEVISELLSRYRGEELSNGTRPAVIYLNSTERIDYIVNINNGIAYTQSGNLMDTRSMNSASGSNSRRCIFVMDQEGNIYIGPMIPGRMQHSSFLSGAPVAAAGEINIEQGIVRSISDVSGHYQPSSAQLQQFRQRLQQLGLADGSYDVRPFLM